MIKGTPVTHQSARRYSASNTRRKGVDSPGSPHTEPRFWIRVGVSGIATFIAGSLCAIIVMQLGGWTDGLPHEVELLERLHTNLPAALDWLVVSLPWLGTNLVFIPVLGPACWYLWQKRARPDLATIIAVVTLGNYIVGTVLKLAFERPRPALWLARGEYTGSSYPSGHAMAVTSVIGMVVILIYEEQGAVWPLCAWILLLGATCYSRLYLGVHWPTDVLGGLLAGGTWLVGMLWARRAQATSASSSDALIPP